MIKLQKNTMLRYTQNTDLFLENLLACIYKRLIDDNERTCYLVG